MTKKLYSISTIILVLISLIIVFEIIRGSLTGGDFVGYINAGNAVINGQDIYADYLNTWPPLFSVFSVLLGYIDSFSSFFIRFVWLTGSVIAMYCIVNESAKLVLNKPISLKKTNKTILIQNTVVLIPLLIILRFFIDNLANVQINIYMLLCSLLTIIFFIKKKYMWVGILLGLTISLKVYTIFFLFYFIYKREFKPVLWTFLFLFLFNSLCILVFGFEQTIIYYHQWIIEIAPKSYIAHHKNQSLFGAFLRFFSSEDPSHNLYVNFLSLRAYTVKKITYLVIVFFALFPAFKLRKKIKDRGSFNSILEYTLIFTAIPILSPISWKAYFIFLWIPYFILYIALYKRSSTLNNQTLLILKYLFWFSVFLNVGSTELIVGQYFSDVMEAYSAITFETIILLVITLFFIVKKEEDIQSINL